MFGFSDPVVASGGGSSGGGGYVYVADPAHAWQDTRIADLDADLCTEANGASVVFFPDKLNDDHTGYNNTASERGILVKNSINQHASIYLAPPYKGYFIPDFPSNLTAMTIAYVAYQPANAGNESRRVISALNQNFLLSINGSLQMYSEHALPAVVAAGYNHTVNQPYLMIAEFDANGFRYYRGGAPLGTSSGASAVGKMPYRLLVGVNTAGEPANCYITRLIVFNSILSSGNKSAFIAAMNTRYLTPLT